MEQYCSSAPLAKLVPLSVMMLFGMPYRTAMSLMNRMAVGPSNFLIGLASIHLVNLPTATSKCVMPPRAVLKGPTMSSPQTAKGQAIGMVRSADAGWWLRLLKRWHPSHLRTSDSASSRAAGQ